MLQDENAPLYVQSFIDWFRGLWPLGCAKNYHMPAIEHFVECVVKVVDNTSCQCDLCLSWASYVVRTGLKTLPPYVRVNYCPVCGHEVGNDIERKRDVLMDVLRDLVNQVFPHDVDQSGDDLFPSCGIYIYWHKHEGYKIGQAENILRRMDKHYCSVPTAKLLHVIETSEGSSSIGALKEIMSISDLN